MVSTGNGESKPRGNRFGQKNSMGPHLMSPNGSKIRDVMALEIMNWNAIPLIEHKM